MTNNDEPASTPASLPGDGQPNLSADGRQAPAGPANLSEKELLRWYQTDYVIDQNGRGRFQERIVLDEAAEPAAPPRRLARLWKPLAAALAAVALAAIAAVWIGLHPAKPPDESGQRNRGEPISPKDMALIEAQLREILPPRQIGEDPSQRQLPVESLGKTKLLLAQGNEEQNVLAKIALRNDKGADFTINALKQEPVNQVFRLLILEGHNWYNAGEFDSAVKSYEQALALQPKNADALRDAAIAHTQARQGDAAAHWARAVELLRQGLEQVDADSAAWCELQNNLGLAWMESPAGDRGDNLKQAMAAFRSAPSKLACDGRQALWARLQNNQGAAWLKTDGGDRVGSLRNAVAAFHATLDVYTRNEHPLEWAMAQNNLGEAWAALAGQPGGDAGENLAQAVAAFRAALEALSRDEHPLEWAKAQNNLGLALDRLPAGAPAENRRQAIAAFQAAEKAYSRTLHPMEWASTRFNQAMALKHLADAESKGCDHLWQSMAYLKAAAGVWTPKDFPLPHKSKVEPLARDVRETWRAQGCGADKALEDIPAAK